MNFDSIIKRANKAIDKASAKAHAAKVHILNFGDKTDGLDGLIIILSEQTSNKLKE